MNDMEHTTKLTAAEMGNLWNFYMANTMSVCILQHFLQHMEDREIGAQIEKAYNFSQDLVDQLTHIFAAEGIVRPKGFGPEDVNLAAPRLYSDTYYLRYLDMMIKMGSIFYSVTLANISRLDLREFFKETLCTTADMSNELMKLMLEKGLHVRPPYIPLPDAVDFVEKQSFFNGFFGKKRPLLGVEISQLFANIQFNGVKVALLTGFSQVAQREELREYFTRGKKINLKQINQFVHVFNEEDLPATVLSQYDITDSTIAPYSDKLMLFHITNLSSAKVRNFGDSIAVSPRHDLPAMYLRMLAETGNFAEDGGNMLIENGWMERPPHAIDRSKLAQKGTNTE